MQQKFEAILIEGDGTFEYIPMTSIVRIQFSDRPFPGMVKDVAELPLSGYIKLTVLATMNPLESIIFGGDSAKKITHAIQVGYGDTRLRVYTADMIERYIIR